VNRQILALWQTSLDRAWLKTKDSERLYELTIVKIERLLSLQDRLKRQPIVWIAESQSIEFITSFVAATIVDTHCFLCNPYWQQSEWQQLGNLVKADLILAQATIQSKIETMLVDIVSQNNYLKSGIRDIESINSLIMIPTGGTSGKIRFAMHTWNKLLASVRGFKTYFQIDRINSYCLLPLYHVSGLMQFLRSWITGGELVVIPYQDLKKERKIIVNYSEYFISLVPTQLDFLLTSETNWLSQFKTILLGGAPASQSLFDRARKYHLALAPTYGMTETASQVATLKPEDFLQGKNNSGKILPHAKIMINKKTEGEKFGEIAIASDSLCLGYYPQLFDSTQLLITDDLGYIDREGYLHIVGRNSQKIITGGENVFPQEVEAAILATQLVMDVCVIGLPDDYWGQIVTAIYISFREEISELSIASQLNLSKYKHPKHWIRVDHIPRNDRGKIDYAKVTIIATNYLQQQ
jgi:O-succinylbenzoic acid--CoA ligase